MDSANDRPRGMTLVEILVALALTSLLVSAALVIAQSQAFVHREQLQSHQIEEDLRGALAHLTRSLRQAGGGAQSGVLRDGLTGATRQVLQITNSNPDQIALVLPAAPMVATLLSPCQSGASSVVVDSVGGAGIQGGDLVLLSDYQNGVLLPVAGRGGGLLSGVSVSTLVLAGSALLPTTYAAGSIVLPMTSLTYSVRPGDAMLLPGVSLFFVDEGVYLGRTGARTGPLAENIVDLEIAVGIDGLNGFPVDGQLSENGAAANDDEWALNVAGEALPAGATIMALRVTLVGRGASPMDRLGPGRPAAEDRPAGAPDALRYRALTETVAVRNLNLR